MLVASLLKFEIKLEYSAEELKTLGLSRNSISSAIDPFSENKSSELVIHIK